MVRKIVRIAAAKCDGCGQCVRACAEGAIAIIQGKARVVSETYCDGLGACLGKCPQDAIIIEERDAPAFDEAAAKKRADKNPWPPVPAAEGGQPAAGRDDLKGKAGARAPHDHGHGACPGAMARQMKRAPGSPADAPDVAGAASQLAHWPVQLKLVSPSAPCFQGADLLLTADCVPVAMPDFHQRFLRGKSVVIACPKLDDPAHYVEKLTAILRESSVKSLTVLHMEVPCCFGLNRIAQAALAASGKTIPVNDVTVTIEGQVKS